VSSNGTVQGFNAPFLGQPRIPPGGWGQHPAAVAIAAAPDGAGYYVLRANGAVDAFGVTGHGSLAGHLHYGATAPVVAVAMAVDPTTGGYWIATSTGDVASFDAPTTDRLQPALTASTTACRHRPRGRDRCNGLLRVEGERRDRQLRVREPWLLATSKALPEGGFASALAVDPTTGGYYVAIDVAPLDGYLTPCER